MVRFFRPLSLYCDGNLIYLHVDFLFRSISWACSEARVVEWACNHLRKQPRFLVELICTCHNGVPDAGVAESRLVFVSAPPRGRRTPRDARVIHADLLPADYVCDPGDTSVVI